MFVNFGVKVSGAKSRRTKVSFREKAESSSAYSAFSLPPDEARQLAYALLLVTSSDEVNSVEFAIDESPSKSVAA